MIIGFSATAQITGKITDSATGKAIERAVIGLVVKNNLTDTTYFFTDEKGEFNISPVPASNFSLLFSSLGYQRVAKFIPVSRQEKQLLLAISFWPPVQSCWMKW